MPKINLNRSHLKSLKNGPLYGCKFVYLSNKGKSFDFEHMVFF